VAHALARPDRTRARAGGGGAAGRARTRVDGRARGVAAVATAELEAACERSRAEVIAYLLPLLDDLELITVVAPRSIQHHPWVDALRHVRLEMIDGLAALGVTRFGAPSDPFDPLVHQVILYGARPELADIRIEAVIKQGYRLGAHPIRPAQVSVVGPPPAP
jgi:molecular chaperone GrpE